METNYIVVFNDKKKGEAPATALCAALQDGAIIISATGTSNSVHYVLGSVPEDPLVAAQSAEEAQIVRDNIDTTHPENRGE